MRKTSLKIQMLAGNSLNVCPDSDSQKKLPLIKNLQIQMLVGNSLKMCVGFEISSTLDILNVEVLLFN